MKQLATGEKLRAWFARLKYPIAILLVGAALLLLPGRSVKEEELQAEASAPAEGQENWEERLAAILSEIQGAGKVKVMLTQDRGSRVLYQQDQELDTDQDEEGKTRRERTQTVILSRGGSNQEALVTQVVGPQFRGALVVCGGGDDPTVRLAVVQAVCGVTGLGADQVTVLKMK